MHPFAKACSVVIKYILTIGCCQGEGTAQKRAVKLKHHIKIARTNIISDMTFGLEAGQIKLQKNLQNSYLLF